MHTERQNRLALPESSRRALSRTPRVIALAMFALVGIATNAGARQDIVSSEQAISWFTGGFPGDVLPGDGLGESVANLGDLDGDGVEDLAVGGPGHDQAALGAGAIWILRMKADGMVKASQRITASLGGFVGPLGLFDLFGSALSGVGDLDGDGVGDLAVGAPGGGLNGHVWILFLNADGTVKSERKIEEVTDGYQLWKHSRKFGSSLSALGDIDGDGTPDLAVGDSDGKSAAFYPNGYPQGKVWILLLHPDGRVKKTVLIGDRMKSGFTGFIGENYFFGHSLARIPDLNGDGVPELAVGVPRDHDGGIDQGAVWILFLNPDGTVAGQQKISVVAGGFDGVLNDDDLFGDALACPGDLDGDGVPDLFVGAPNDDDGGFQRGAVWVLFLNPDGTVKSHAKLSAAHGGLFGPIDDEDRFGDGLAWLGDLDGDGVGTLAAGSTGWDHEFVINTGAVWSLDIDWTCGDVTSFGVGCPGSGGITPSLNATGCVGPGQPITFSVGSALGGSNALLISGASAATIPYGGGCDLLVQPWPFIATLPVSAGGSVSIDASLPLSSPASAVYLQAFVLDPSAPAGASSSPGLILGFD